MSFTESLFWYKCCSFIINMIAIQERNNHKLEIVLGQSSLTGLRERNEDFYACIKPQKVSTLNYKGIAAVIADGVGDTGYGQEASRYAVSTFFSEYFSTPDSWSIERSGEEVIKSINSWLYSQSERNIGDSGLMTAFSAAILCGSTLHIFHVGDTRIYLKAKNKLKRLTKDHRAHHGQNQIIRALGLDSNVYIDYTQEILEPDSSVIMMTDGVHNYLSDDKITGFLNKFAAPQVASEALTMASLREGSTDNISCQIINIKHLPPSTKNEIYQRSRDLKFPPPLKVGAFVDSYEIQEELGYGAMGIVYSAYDSKNDKVVALKCPRQEFEQDIIFRERLLREEWIGQRVHNPNLMKVLNPSHVRMEYHYLVMEYCKGFSLREQLDSGKHFSHNDVVEIAKQICRGLTELHHMEIVHRDIKPDSIIWSQDGMVKIIDYGIAKVGSLKSLTSNANAPWMGSPNYMAPEMFKNSRGNSVTDIFSLGVTMYELLTSSMPYGEIDAGKGYKNTEFVSLQELNPEVPSWLSTVVVKCLHLDPDSRYQAASEVLYDLEHPEKVLPDMRFIPLLERNPVLVWKVISATLLGIVVVLSVLLIRGR